MNTYGQRMPRITSKQRWSVLLELWDYDFLFILCSFSYGERSYHLGTINNILLGSFAHDTQFPIYQVRDSRTQP